MEYASNRDTHNLTCVESEMVEFMEAESGLVGARGWGEGGRNEGMLAKGYKVSVLQEECILEV